MQSHIQSKSSLILSLYGAETRTVTQAVTIDNFGLLCSGLVAGLQRAVQQIFNKSKQGDIGL